MGIVSVSFKGSGSGYFTPVSFDSSNTKTLLHIYYFFLTSQSQFQLRRAKFMPLRYQLIEFDEDFIQAVLCVVRINLYRVELQ
jgi:hypothetical protein